MVVQNGISASYHTGLMSSIIRTASLTGVSVNAMWLKDPLKEPRHWECIEMTDQELSMKIAALLQWEQVQLHGFDYLFWKNPAGTDFDVNPPDFITDPEMTVELIKKASLCIESSGTGWKVGWRKEFPNRSLREWTEAIEDFGRAVAEGFAKENGLI